MRPILFVSAGFLLVSLLFVGVAGQGFPISVNFGTGLPVPIGQTPTVAVTVKDISNDNVQLIFVGLRFEWDGPNNFFIGDNSEKGAVLAPGEELTYAIPVTVPANVTPGTHRLNGYVTYRILSQGNFTQPLAGWWVADLQFAYPQTQQNQTTAEAGSASQQSSTFETVGVVVAVVAIALFLERGRIMRLAGKRGEEKPSPPEVAGDKPQTMTEKQESRIEREEEVDL